MGYLNFDVLDQASGSFLDILFQLRQILAGYY